MSDRDNDFEFDFFDEPETREASPTERGPRLGVGAGRTAAPRPPLQMTPLLRLVGLVAFAIVLVVLLVFLVDSCGSSSKRGAYEDYFEQVRAVGRSSEQLGRQLSTTLNTPGLKQADLDPKLRGLAQQQLQGAARAQEVRAPGPLRIQQQHVVEALQLRATGIQRLADAFRLTAQSKDLATASRLLADQAARLVASDVLWDDLFRSPTTDELERQGLTGLTVPDSNFVQNPDLASSRAWAPVLQRIRGASTGASDGLLHGNQLVSVVAQPGSQRLTPAPEENTVKATTDLAFEVTIEDTGDAQEVQVAVRLTIQQSPRPIRKTAFVDVINPGEQAKVVFRNLGPVQFATRTTVRVEVQPVPGEANTGNNSAEYPVIFSLG
jgi:hypothetical protein